MKGRVVVVASSVRMKRRGEAGRRVLRVAPAWSGCNERDETEQADGSGYAWGSSRRRASMSPLVQMLGLVKRALGVC